MRFTLYLITLLILPSATIITISLYILNKLMEAEHESLGALWLLLSMLSGSVWITTLCHILSPIVKEIVE